MNSDLPQPGERLGDYEVIEEIARGGMGVVYKAKKVGLGRLVALKVLRSRGDAPAEEIRRFQREAQAAASLTHPNVVSIHDMGEDQQGRWFLIMDLIEGESLGDRLTRDGPMNSQAAARMTLGIARGLAHAHANGVLHRDLKPRNILLNATGEPMITDFGLAKVVEEGDTTLTISGQILGTPAYMSPEQACGEREHVDVRTDVYAVGATLYQMLTGFPPFRAKGVARLLVKIMTLDPEPPRRLQPAVDEPLERVCLKCLQKNPGDRYATAEELERELLSYLEQGEVQATEPDRVAWGKRMEEAKTEEERTSWVRRGALAGDSGAMNLLGLRLVKGVGCEQDFAEAYEWGIKAAELGHAEAMYGLGLIHELGMGRDKDQEQAIYWYRRAIASGDSFATDRLQSLLAGGDA